MAVLTPRAKPAEPSGSEQIHPLENGDRLTRAEFERRYDAMPDLKKAELIEGEVYVASPVRHRRHSKPHSSNTWLVVEFTSPGRQAWRRATTAVSAWISTTNPSPTPTS